MVSFGISQPMNFGDSLFSPELSPPIADKVLPLVDYETPPQVVQDENKKQSTNLSKLQKECSPCDFVKILQEGKEISTCLYPSARNITKVDFGMYHKLTSVNMIFLMYIFSELKSLSLPAGVCGDVISSIGAHRTIEKLDLRESQTLTNDGLVAISNSKSIKHLNLSLCINISDVGISHISKLSSLEYLNLSWCDNVTNMSLSTISQLEHLSHLDLRGCRGVGDRGIGFIAKLPILGSFHISDCEGISDTGLKSLSQVKTLKTLELTYCKNISMAGVKSIDRLQNLSYLNLRGCKGVDDVCVRIISNFLHLAHLDLGDCGGITNAGISKNIHKLKNLKYLDLSGSELLDNGVIGISQLPNLKFLFLNKCIKITIASISLLARMKALQSLSLVECDNSVKAAASAIPPRIKVYS